MPQLLLTLPLSSRHRIGRIIAPRVAGGAWFASRWDVDFGGGAASDEARQSSRRPVRLQKQGAGAASLGRESRAHRLVVTERGNRALVGSTQGEASEGSQR